MMKRGKGQNSIATIVLLVFLVVIVFSSLKPEAENKNLLQRTQDLFKVLCYNILLVK